MKYTGSIWKRSRRLGISISETEKELQKRNYRPGQHGNNRHKSSEYDLQLIEKQKLTQLYGINKKQFKRLFLRAKKIKNNTTILNIFQILESRLDNLIYRMGFASTRPAARQLVNHGFVYVNNKKNNIPSYICQINDVISIPNYNKKINNIEKKKITFPTVKVENNEYKGTYIKNITKDEIMHNIDGNLIIEWCNRFL